MDIDMKMVAAIVAIILMAIFAFSGDDVLNQKNPPKQGRPDND